MMNQPPGQKRLWTNYFNVAANNTLQQFTFTTLDDFRTRHVDSIFVGVTTLGMSIALYAMGQEYSVIDLTRFAAGDQIVKVQFDLPAKIQMNVGLQDLTSAGNARVPVILGYYVDPGSGP